jgi:tetratricopeptide (TPR) repeat protein
MADSPRIEELKRRVQGDPASIAFAALAEEYRRAERYQEAIETCTAGLVRHPSYLSAHVTLGRALMELGRLQEAQQELEFVLKLAPENLAAIRGLAEIHHRLGDEQGHHPIPLSPPVAMPAAEPMEAISVAEVQAASGAVTVEAEQPTQPPDHSALPALEQLLSAIQRARADRVAAR